MADIPKPPGTRKQCRCLALLAILHEYPDGPIEECFTGSGYAITRGYILHGWPWCPECGGRMGLYRPELAEAYRRHREAESTLLDHGHALDTREEVIAACTARGGSPTGDSDYHVTFAFPEAHTEVTGMWDPDHEHWHTSTSFLVPPSCEREHFTPESLAAWTPGS